MCVYIYIYIYIFIRKISQDVTKELSYFNNNKIKVSAFPI